MNLLSNVRLFTKAFDPFGIPKPGINMKDVPVKTSYFFRLYIPDNTEDKVDPDSITFTLYDDKGKGITLLDRNRVFAPGCTGIIKAETDREFDGISVFIDSDIVLKYSTTYKIVINARSEAGASILEEDSEWSFTTADKEPVSISYNLDFERTQPVEWEGQIFGGIVKPDFCSTKYYGLERHDFIQKAQEDYPNAWRWHRDFWLTGYEHAKPGFSQHQPNIVREKETRRITALKKTDDGVLLKVDDFYGHEQYGIESGRPISDDYAPGYEILIADDKHSVKAFVISVNDSDSTVLVTSFENPPGGWQLEYPHPLPDKENPDIPGLFPTGGTYLRRYNPVGTPHYYWGRLHQEWDILAKKYGRLLMPGFCDAPGDLSCDGRPWTYPKDYAQYHEVVYTITSHIIERYGDITTKWIWSVLNEPDLYTAFWRSNNWTELLKFYDYSVDAILRAFEDHGYDSEKIIIGGLELGAVAGTNLRIHDFLIHCSPNVEGPQGAEYNAAYKDSRLDGKRSKRVEDFCKKSGGKGCPVDFVSVHTYNSSKMAADKLIKAKEIALEIDPEYYADLYVNNFESVPDWMGIPDLGASECYLGNGYYSSWAADLAARLLNKAASDSRYNKGLTILTVWPWTCNNMSPANDVVRCLRVDMDGDGEKDTDVIIPMPIFHFINLMSTMGNQFYPFPLKQVGGHTVSGYMSKCDKGIKIVLYSHDLCDTQSRSERTINVSINLDGLGFEKLKADKYYFDKENNTYFEWALNFNKNISKKIEDVEKLTNISDLRHLLSSGAVMTKEQYEEVEKLSWLNVTESTDYVVNAGKLDISITVPANGVVFIDLNDISG